MSDFFKQILTPQNYENFLKIVPHTAQEYKTFKLPKKSGGFRFIDAPSDRLKNIQSNLYYAMSSFLPTHPCAVGFIKSLAIEDGVKRHLGNKVLLGLDLKDFFPSITYYHLTRLFKLFANRWAQRGGALLTIEDIQQLLRISTLRGRLPQGSPLSPFLANVALYQLDEQLNNIAKSCDCVYTRYADDLTFSHKNKNFDIGQLISPVAFAIHNKRLKINWKKVRIARPNSRLEITGMVINEFLSIPKDYIMRVKAQSHQIQQKYAAGEYINPVEIKQLKGKLLWISKKYKNTNLTKNQALIKLWDKTIIQEKFILKKTSPKWYRNSWKFINQFSQQSLQAQ